MNNKNFPERYRTLFVLSFFAMALVIVGAVLGVRTGALLDSYTEKQTGKQAKAYALLMEEKLDTEIENLEYIASKLEASLESMDDLMPRIYNDPGVKQGLIGIDGKALYGDDLDVGVYEGIQSSFRGSKAMTFAGDDGLLFTCPVFHGPNIRYVLYRLCPSSVLEDYFAVDIYDDLGKICVTTRDGQMIIPFYQCSEDDLFWYESEDIQSKYATMHREMEVSVAVADIFSTDRGEMVLFESEIPGTDFLVSGYVPKAVASEGIGNITYLVIWVFGLLMLLVMIGAYYLSRVLVKARENDELRKAKAIAEETAKAKGDFLANMSHEIRTPINAMLGLNEMILREAEDETILDYSESIKAAGSTLLGLINDVLDFSKIESGKIDILPVDYDLSSVLGDLVNMISTRADQKGLELKTDFDPNTPKMLNGDEIRIKQVITNLLTNAVKYTEKGSVTFKVGYERSQKEQDVVFLSVSVEDTGIGIREEDMDRLFGEFERIEESRNRYVEGTGLGMSITKSLLDMMGSSLEVKSRYGEGSSFSFILKQKVVSPSPLGDYAASYREHLMKHQKYKEAFTAPDAQILVVDDNLMNLTVFKGLVKKTLIKVDTAEDGNRALALTKDKKYDIIFLDHMMPGKDGIETLKEVKVQAEGKNAETPEVCLTANAISGSREIYTAAGFDEYLTKPIDAERLEELLLSFLPEEKITKTEQSRTEATGADGENDEDGGVVIPPELEKLGEQDWIDVEAGVRNSGSAEAYMPLLGIFYSSIAEKTEELERFYAQNDIQNYTIKVHALKSSARIIGAAQFGEKAQKLEDAGKSGDIAYIRENHAAFLKEFQSFSEPLSLLFEKEETSDKPAADPELMEAVFEELRLAADDMDCDRLEGILQEMEEYSIPDKYAELWKKIREATENYDYGRVSELIPQCIE